MTVSPTLKSRIQSLDVLRGVAILGILLANVFAFGWMEASEMLGYKSEVPGMNYWAEGLRVAFVTGKFRGLFCLLFGAGLFLQYGKLKAAGKWPLTYLKRNVILMGIGAVHLVFIWYGDILLMYSLTAFIVMWMAGLEDRPILGISIGMLALSSLCGIGAVAGQMASGSSGGGGGSRLSSSNELRIFQSGSYLEQLQFRLPVAGISLAFFFFIFLELGALFLIGLWMARKGIFAKPSAHPKITLGLLIVGGIGALMNLVIGVAIAMTRKDDLSIVVEYGLNAPMSIGYATLGAILVEKFPGAALSRLLAPVGRMALTGYLLTSLLCTTFFYSWGLGFFGKLDYWGLLFLVVVVWVIIVMFAHLWLRKYAMGPVEWVWRTLTLGSFYSKPEIESEPTSDGANLPPVIR